MSDPLNSQRAAEGGGESPSAYASAESSPSPSMTTSLSMHSIRTSSGGADEFILVNKPGSGGSSASGMPVSHSMNSLGSRSPSQTHHINLTAIPNSMSVSGIDALAKLEELNMQGFTSLPPAPRSSPETVKQVIEKTVKSEIEKVVGESPTSKSQTSPGGSQRSSVFSVFGRIFKSAASKTSSTTSPTTDDKDKAKTSGLSPTSSSPNPETSPFKLIQVEPGEKLRESEREPVINSDVKEAGKSPTSIDKLVQLNDEKLDPILSPASAAARPRSRSPKHDTMKVPASSHEFCMDLNLNIAAAAARAADAPVAICDAGSSASKGSKSSHHCGNNNDHQRFTKNASTSSIHNDLKAILEESKESAASLQLASTDGKKTESASPVSTKTTPKPKKRNTSSKAASAAAAAAAAGTSTDDSVKKSDDHKSPKPQREKKSHRSKHSKSSEKKSSPEKKQQQQQQQLETKINVLELLMKTAAAVESKPPTSSSSSNKRNPLRYSREFLVQIRDERAKLIDNICPDIFRAHSYCISGTYWDPEKYFNAMLHGERLYDLVNNNLPSVKDAKPLNHHHRYNNNFGNQATRRWTKKNNSESKPPGSWSLPHTSGSQHPSMKQPHPLSDKNLLDLLKNNSSSSAAVSTTSPRLNGGIELMNMLNKKHANNLFSSNENSAQPRHHPIVLTAQELEFSQLFDRPVMTSKVNRTPERNQHQNTTSGSSPASSSRSSNLSPSSLSSSGGNAASNVCGADELDADNSSDAYKQLIKNLSNHPLSAPPKAAPTISAVDALFNRSKSKESPMQTPEGSNLLKQLLKINTNNHEDSMPHQSSYNRASKAPNNYFGQRNQKFGRTVGPQSQQRANQGQYPRKAPVNNDIESKEKFRKMMEMVLPNLEPYLAIPSGSSESGKSSDNIMKWFRNSSVETSPNGQTHSL